VQDFRHTLDLGGGTGHDTGPRAGDEQVDVAQRLGRRHRVQRALVERLAVMLGQDQGRHQITPASCFSFATSSWTEPTFTPAWRLAGSSKRR
jgi:hypothetical protein